jgi:hypothetical protein
MKSKTGIHSFAGVHAPSILLYFNVLDFTQEPSYFMDRTSLSTPSALPPENAPSGHDPDPGMLADLSFLS